MKLGKCYRGTSGEPVEFLFRKSNLNQIQPKILAFIKFGHGFVGICYIILCVFL